MNMSAMKSKDRLTFEQFFFALTDVRNLILFRVLYCTVLAGVHVSQMRRVEYLYSSPLSIYFPIPLFEGWGLGQLPLNVVRGCGIILLLGLVGAASGVWTRLALTTSWITFFFFYGTILGFEKPEPNVLSFYTYHYNNIVFFVLVILSVAPQIDWWGAKTIRKYGWRGARDIWWQATAPLIPVWPLVLMKVTLAFAYFGAGFTKLISSGPLWIDGDTLQAYFLMKHLQEGAWVGYWMAQSYWICVIASVGTLVLELTFLVVPFLQPRSRLVWVYVISGLGFHLMTAVSMNIIHFIPFMCLTYFVFLDWPTVCELRRRLFVRSSLSSDSSGLPARAMLPLAVTGEAWEQADLGVSIFIAAVVGILSASIFLNVELWPLSDFGVFRNRSHYSKIQVGQVRGIDKEQREHWLHPEDFGPGFHGLYDGGNFPRFYLAHLERSQPALRPFSLLIDGTGLRFLVWHFRGKPANAFANWRERMLHDGPGVLREFHRRLPTAVQMRFPTLEFVNRAVQRDADGSLVPVDTVVFSTATP